MKEKGYEATKEELKASRVKCWSPQCRSRAILKDWTGWQFCLKHWRRDYKWGRCHGLWRAIKDSKIVF